MDEEKQLDIFNRRAFILREEQEMYRRAIEVSVSAIRELDKVGVSNIKDPLSKLITDAVEHLTDSINSVHEKLSQA